MNKTIVRVIPDETVAIPRTEYNELITAKHERDMILATSDPSGYGCADIVKGALQLNAHMKAYKEAKQRIADLEAELAFRNSPPRCRCSSEPVFTKENPEDAPMVAQEDKPDA